MENTAQNRRQQIQNHEKQILQNGAADNIHELRNLTAVLHGIKREKCFENTVINRLGGKKDRAYTKNQRQYNATDFFGKQADHKRQKYTGRDSKQQREEQVFRCVINNQMKSELVIQTDQRAKQNRQNAQGSKFSLHLRMTGRSGSLSRFARAVMPWRSLFKKILLLLIHDFFVSHSNN